MNVQLQKIALPDYSNNVRGKDYPSYPNCSTWDEEKTRLEKNSDCLNHRHRNQPHKIEKCPKSGKTCSNSRERMSEAMAKKATWCLFLRHNLWHPTMQSFQMSVIFDSPTQNPFANMAETLQTFHPPSRKYNF